MQQKISRETREKKENEHVGRDQERSSQVEQMGKLGRNHKQVKPHHTKIQYVHCTSSPKLVNLDKVDSICSWLAVSVISETVRVHVYNQWTPSWRYEQLGSLRVWLLWSGECRDKSFLWQEGRRW